VKLVFEEKVLNVLNAYAPQIRYEESEKEEFWQEKDEVI